MKVFNSLIGKKIYFKALSVDDVNEIHEYASNKDVSRFIGWKLMGSIEESKMHIEKMLKEELAKSHLYASVSLKSNNKVIATVMIFNFDHNASHAEIGYVFHQDYWGKGYCTEAVSLISNFAFNTLKLHKLHARVADENIGSSKVLEKNGFELEGRLRDHYFIENKYYDCLLYGKISI